MAINQVIALTVLVLIPLALASVFLVFSAKVLFTNKSDKGGQNKDLWLVPSLVLFFVAYLGDYNYSKLFIQDYKCIPSDAKSNLCYTTPCARNIKPALYNVFFKEKWEVTNSLKCPEGKSRVRLNEWIEHNKKGKTQSSVKESKQLNTASSTKKNIQNFLSAAFEKHHWYDTTPYKHVNDVPLKGGSNPVSRQV